MNKYFISILSANCALFKSAQLKNCPCYLGSGEGGGGTNISTEATRKGLAMSKPVSGYLSLPGQHFLVDVLQFEHPAIYWHP